MKLKGKKALVTAAGQGIGRAITERFIKEKGSVLATDVNYELIKDIETEIFKEFFQSFSQSAEITLHIENIYGQNTHHIIESCFKSVAISLRNAIEFDFRNLDSVPSTKGTLTGIK